MLNKDQAKRMVSAATYNQLSKYLYALEHITAPRDIIRTKERLRDSIVKIFTYKDVFELHDDHILELAETLVGIYPEREDLNGYVYHILSYLNKRISKYHQLCKTYTQQLTAKETTKEKDPNGYLDLKYKVWTYTDGYYYQQAHMYQLLYQSLSSLLWYAERGMICRKKRASS